MNREAGLRDGRGPAEEDRCTESHSFTPLRGVWRSAGCCLPPRSPPTGLAAGPAAAATIAPAPLAECVGAPEVEGWRGRYGAAVDVDYAFYCGPGYDYPAAWYAYWAGRNANWFDITPVERACETWHFRYEGRWYCYNGPM